MRISNSEFFFLLFLTLEVNAIAIGLCDESQRCGFLCCSSSDVCIFSALCAPIPAISSALAALPTSLISPEIIASALREATTDRAQLASLVDKYQPSVKAPATVVGLDGNPIVMPTATEAVGDLKDGEVVFSIALPIETRSSSAVGTDKTRESSTKATSTTNGSGPASAVPTEAETMTQKPTNTPDSGTSAMNCVGKRWLAIAMGMAVVAGWL